MLADAEDAADTLTAWWEDGATRLDAVETTPTSTGEILGYTFLTEGEHALELHVQDSAGNEGIATTLVAVGPPNASPMCTITAPTNLGASESGARIDFLATVSDADIQSNLLSVTWESDKDGLLGSSSPDSAGNVSFSTSNLSVNTHRITMTVTDEVGATCASAITYTIGTAPTIFIEQPLLNEVDNDGDIVTFSAIVSDSEDVPSNLWVRWESDRDGLIYEGPPDSTGVAQFLESGLSVGNHALTVTVTDSTGLYATALGAFTINGVPSTTVISLSPSTPYTNDDLVVTIDSPAMDPDGDPITYLYAWSVDGVPSAVSNSGTLPANATTHGETWSVSVTASDRLATSTPATASTRISNTPPVAAVSLTPANPTIASTLVCSASATDDDADVVTYGFTWTVDGTVVSASSLNSANATLVGVFSSGQVVSCTITANDGAGGTHSAATSLTIQNTAPVIASVTLAPAVIYTNDTLTITTASSDADGDRLTLSYDWYVDGVLVQTGSNTNLSGVTRFSRDQVVYVITTANDGATSTQATSNSVTVRNTAPTATSAAIDPTPAYESSTLTCIPAGFADVDGDSEGWTYTWTVNGRTAGTTSTLNGSVFNKGDRVVCTATPVDGTDSGAAVTSTAVTISNAAPVLSSVALSTYTPTETDTITVALGAATDADGDAISYGYTWYVNGSVVGTTNTLTSSRFKKNDSIYVVITPWDGTDYGSPVASPIATGTNTAPTISSVTLSPSTVYTNTTITANVVSADADGDTIAYTYHWYVDGFPTGSTSSASLSGVSYFDKNQTVYVSVTPNDGDTNGLAVASSVVTVANTAPTSPVVEITPVNPENGDDLTCTVITASTDADGDSVTYDFDWDVDGVTYTGAIDGTTDSVVDGGDVQSNENWRCTVTPNDGYESGPSGQTNTQIGCWVGSFDGASNEIEVADASDFSIGTGAFTVEAWFETESSSSSPLCLISKRGLGGTGQGLALVAEGGTNSSVLCHLHNKFSYLYALTPANVADGQWHHLAVMRDGVHSVSCFSDGVLVSTGVFSENLTSGSRLYIGACNYEAENNSSVARYEGEIAEVRWSNTTEYPTTGFTPSYPLPVTSQTVALWGFNRNTNTIVYDSASGSHNGIFDGTIVYKTCPQ